jgi:nicotinate-nucleotide adenylyltransferase
MSRRVAIFGGSFNPPHLAHQMAITGALEIGAVDEVWVVPTYRHAFGKDLEPFADRVEMCRRMAVRLGPEVTVSTVEAEIGGESRTLYTLERLVELLPGTVLRLLIGADILAETHSWYRWDEVERLAPPLVFGRSGHHSDGCDLVLPDISSTEARRRLAAGESVRELLPAAVASYIVDRGLYR